MTQQTTMFTKVAELNTLWGNLKGDPTNPDWKKLSDQGKNILDEYNELFDDGINPRNMNEVRDAICDILVFTLGLAHMAGIDVDADMTAVDASNRSKFCHDMEDMEATILKYRSLGVEVQGEGAFPLAFVRSTSSQVGNDKKLYQNNKILKSVSFKEPVFAEL